MPLAGPTGGRALPLERGMHVFLSYSVMDRSPAEVVRRLLTNLDVSVTNAFDRPVGLSLKNSLVEQVREADVVVGVIGREGVTAGVLLELGIAQGADRPTVLVLQSRDQKKELPPALLDLQTIVLGGDERAVGERLIATLETLSLATGSESEVGHHVTAQRVLKERDWADDSERRVGEALARLSAEVVTQAGGNQSNEVDLAIWMPGLPTPALNPIFVEVTGRRPAMEPKLARLRRDLKERESLLGMIVTPDDRDYRWLIESESAILVIGVEVLERLTSSSFARLVAEGRNDLFHSSK